MVQRGGGDTFVGIFLAKLERSNICLRVRSVEVREKIVANLEL